MMRTTLDVDDDVLASARTLAAELRISIGQALSQLARQGLAAPRVDDSGDLPVFTVTKAAGPITPEMVAAASEDG